ncbi:MAG: hypothetical protein ACOX79_08410 [Methanosarcina sp.]|jgi:hypothetical protein
MSKTSVLKIVLYCLFTLVLACVPAASSESLAESEHPYANNSEYKWSNISEPGATEIRLHFSDLDIGRYDKLIILDKYGNDLITYSGITKADFWTEWYAGDTLGVRLITSDQGTRYGFKIDKLDSRPDMCIPNNSLAESYHPYANNFEYKWPDISEPSATQIRIHFESLNLNYYDKLILFDKYDNNLATYDWNSDKSFWTEWYTGDTLKVKLITDESRTAYGFKIDKLESRSDVCISNNSLAESYHPYANNFEYKWPDITKPGATQIRLHFENFDLNYYDRLFLFDKYDNHLATYDWNSNKSFWTEWYTGDTLKVKLTTDDSRTAYGFKIDKGEIKNDENITTAFSGSKEVNNEISRSKPEKSEDSEFSGEDSEKPQNPTINSDYIHNQFVKIAVTLNILEEDDDQSWIYRNIELVFGGFGTPLLLAMVGFLKRLKGKRSEDKKSEDEKSENEKPEDEK